MNSSSSRVAGRRRLIVSTLAIFLLSALPRVLALGGFLTTDERFWIESSRDFLGGLVSSEFICPGKTEHKGQSVLEAGQGFDCTLRAGHPGVITMWNGSLGIWFYYFLTANDAESLLEFIRDLSVAPADAAVIPLGQITCRGANICGNHRSVSSVNQITGRGGRKRVLCGAHCGDVNGLVSIRNRFIAYSAYGWPGNCVHGAITADRILLLGQLCLSALAGFVRNPGRIWCFGQESGAVPGAYYGFPGNMVIGSAAAVWRAVINSTENGCCLAYGRRWPDLEYNHFTNLCHILARLVGYTRQCGHLCF